MTSIELKKQLNHIGIFADKVGELGFFIEENTPLEEFPKAEACEELYNKGFGTIQNTIDYEQWQETYQRDIKSFENTIWHLTDIGATEVANKTSEAKEVYVNKILPICEKFIKDSLVYNCELLGYSITVK